MKFFTAILTAPDGSRSKYHVEAPSKTEARKKVAEIYRQDVPRNAAAHGFYSFSQQKLAWEEIQD